MQAESAIYDAEQTEVRGFFAAHLRFCPIVDVLPLILCELYGIIKVAGVRLPACLVVFVSG